VTASARPSKAYDRSLVEGPLGPAVWKLAWPTMLTNIFGGLQALVDHVMVGHYVGHTANAGIGVANQIWIVIIVFIMSVFTGMSVLVSRFVGAGERDKADRTVYQALLASAAMSFGVLAPVGLIAAPWLLDFVNAAPEVQAQALPYLRISMVFSAGFLLFFLVSGALRAAGDARTPMVLGVAMTVLNVVLNVIFIGGVGPIPALGTAGAAIGSVIAALLVGGYALWRIWRGGWVIGLPHDHRWGPDWPVIASLFRFGLPSGVQGIVMNIGGVLLLAFIGSLPQSAAAQAAYAVGYGQLFAFITWTSVGLMGAAATIAGQNLGAGHPERAVAGVGAAARIAVTGAALVGVAFALVPDALFGIFGIDDRATIAIGTELLRVLSVSGLFIAVALTYTGGLQGTGDTRSPLYISIVSQVVLPLGICLVLQQAGRLTPVGIWAAILVGHVTRCTLSVVRFNQGRWRDIRVDIASSPA
jgi:putative MATE family efflux protein